MSYGGALDGLAWAVLLAGFGYAAIQDLRVREAPDGVWVVLGSVGAVLGGIAVAPGGIVPLLFWAAVSALLLEHFFAWDVGLERRSPALPGVVELAGYGVVGASLGVGAYVRGVSSTAVPPVALAAFVAIVLVRAAFELGLLYGGADAKALIASAALVPLGPLVIGPIPAGAGVAADLPGPLTLLMNAALLSIAVPVGLALRNLRDGTFDGLPSFVGYVLPVSELSRRFVWLRDPVFGGASEEERAVDSTEEDTALRARQQAELEAKGVRTVWVTPQLPFLVFFFASAIVTLLFGNLLFDLLALL